jgi:hypothetical protein
MKISPKKKGQIYDLVHQMFMDRRIDIRRDYMPITATSTSDDLKNKIKIDYQIAQLEIPLAQAIIKLIQGKTKE